MAYKEITEAEIQSGQAVKGPGGFGEKTRDNFIYLTGLVGLAANDILNGSFEVEGDTGIPANWDRTLFSGGAGAFETTAPMHGARGYKFTHPGGGGNGGGSLESEYFAIGTIRNLMLEWMHYVSAAGMHETVEVEYFTGPQVSISTQTIYDSASNPTSATSYQRPLVIPATARFLKVKVIGGDDDVDVAGISYWDGLRIVFEPLRDGDATVVPDFANLPGFHMPCLAAHPDEESEGSQNFTKQKEVRLARGGDLAILFWIKRGGVSHTGSGRIYRNGSPVGANIDTTSTSYVSHPQVITGWSAGDLLQLYSKVGASGGGEATLVRDLAIHSNTLFGEEIL